VLTKPAIMLKILFLGANPRNTTRIRIDAEVREIDTQLRLSAGRQRLELEQAWAVRTDDLQQSLIDNEPQIVHFSGHGGTTGIVVEDDEGNAKEVGTEAISELFELFKESVKCVLLNACYSEEQAKAIVQHIPYVIGMSDAMPDEAAMKFSVGFYKAIASGKTVEFAFGLGVNAIKLEGLGGEMLPKLLQSQHNLILLPPEPKGITTLGTGASGTGDGSTSMMTPQKWWMVGGGGVLLAVITGIASYYFASNKPVIDLDYSISGSPIAGLYRDKTDSLLLSFPIVCDNNTPKDLYFVRDSFTLCLTDSDYKFRPTREGLSRVVVRAHSNKTVMVNFVSPMKLGGVTLNVAQRHGVAQINYGFSTVTEPRPVVATNENKPNTDTAAMPLPAQDMPPKTKTKRTHGEPTKSAEMPPPPAKTVEPPMPDPPSTEKQRVPQVGENSGIHQMTQADAKITLSPEVLKALAERNRPNIIPKPDNKVIVAPSSRALQPKAVLNKGVIEFRDHRK
jgi:hypothetical protein